VSALNFNRVIGVALLIGAALATWMVTLLYFSEQGPEESPTGGAASVIRASCSRYPPAN